MDDDNIYFGLLVRDAGKRPVIETPATPNGLHYDHLRVYLGLFDMVIRAGSPHIEGTKPGATNFQFINPVNEETSDANRHYRIAPGTDNTESPLGPDYQLLAFAPWIINAIPVLKARSLPMPAPMWTRL